MAEGNRLLSGCTGNCTPGSNPGLSAKFPKSGNFAENQKSTFEIRLWRIIDSFYSRFSIFETV